MRGLLILAVIILVMALVGWITFQNNDRQPAVILNTDKIEADTREIVHEGQEAATKAGQAVQAAVDEVRSDRRPDAPADEAKPATSAPN
ncbi:hypothetical protein [Planctomicrobium piriforme]|uniref:Uncharacterized protein n=1 Tax=Planctomicrobium piriforme TaxID=1576369 RepID=A0A1I3PFR8_9PLAN|nr:hypothetical protein [Planctomicrobium piriforme]SFJ20395.1 hypothetical protein SAMN05421753_116142 [Planctomicrobium piriforme]